MTPALLVLALALAAQETPPTPTTSDAARSATSSSPRAEAQSPASAAGSGAQPTDGTGAPTAGVDPRLVGATEAGAAPADPFGLVSWCAGAVQGYLALKPDIYPEVKRIETQFRRPGSNLAEDLQDYADMEKDARRQMGVFQDAIASAEKTSPVDLSNAGLAAYKRGLAVWAAPTNATKARIAQEWMSWALPAACETTAKSLVTQASLMGEALKPTAAAVETSGPVQDAPPATPPVGAPSAPSTETAAAAAPVATDAATAAPTRPVDTPKVRSVKKKKSTRPVGG